MRKGGGFEGGKAAGKAATWRHAFGATDGVLAALIHISVFSEMVREAD